ncbi:MAG: ATP-binding protein [Candidatus Nanopelagicales bacterium]
MKQLAVISGKGGTGKTTVTAAFAALARNAVVADCDVDAADLHLILNPTIEAEQPFHGVRLAQVDQELCTGCGECLEHCRFAAITADFSIVRDRCEGCGVCELVCPAGAIAMVERVSGVAYTSTTRFGPMAHAALGIGEEASGLLTTLVRRNAVDLASRHDRDLVIIDGPPGIGCPAIAAITGVDLVLVVTEPTVSGMHDLDRVLAMVQHFGIPAAVAVNKSDINPENAARILTMCQDRVVPVVGILPYDESVTRAMIEGRTLPESSSTGLAAEVTSMWSRLERMLVDG